MHQSRWHCFPFAVCLSGLEVVPYPHHSQGAIHCLQLQWCLLQGRAQHLRDGGVLQRFVSVARPAASRPAADQWQRLWSAVLPAWQGAEPQVRAGVQLHAQGLFLRPLSGLPGQRNRRILFHPSSFGFIKMQRSFSILASCRLRLSTVLTDVTPFPPDCCH